MSSEFDKDIDSLLREGARRGHSAPAQWSATRHADGGVRATPSGAHLDADELNAYAENALPAAARAHHTKHLADCDDCRRSVTTLALAAGMPAQLEQREAATAATARQKVITNAGWRERLGALFAPRAWRYAVPALALLLVGAVALVVFMRGRQSETSLAGRNASEGAKPSLAQTEQHHTAQQNSSDAAATTANESAANAPNSNAPAPSAKEGVVLADGSVREEQSLPKSGVVVSEDATPLQPQPAPATGSGAIARAITEMPMPTPAPLPPPAAEPVTVTQERDAKVKSAESVVEVAKDAPQKQADYENMQREQAANARRAEKLSGPRRNSNNEQARNTRTMNAGELSDRADKNDEGVAATTTAPAAPRATAAAKRARQRDADSERDETKPSDNSMKSESRRAPESAGETRSVGGRRFRKQGGAWVDTAYSAGQTITVVRRNSEQYRALVADEPAIGRIAGALGGEVTVVWKGRAYRIR